MKKVVEFTEQIEFISRINEHKSCLMAQDRTWDDPSKLWFNIDVPNEAVDALHLQPGDQVKITVERVEE